MLPYKFNDTEILFPLTWEESRGVVEAVNVSEAGTDIVQVSRMGKLTIKASFKVSKEWLATLQSFSELPSFTLSRYDAVTDAYSTHTVRIRGFSAKLIKYSWKLPSQSGLWEVSFNLLEV